MERIQRWRRYRDGWYKCDSEMMEKKSRTSKLKRKMKLRDPNARGGLYSGCVPWVSVYRVPFMARKLKS